jgi:hypothetical protein
MQHELCLYFYWEFAVDGNFLLPYISEITTDFLYNIFTQKKTSFALERKMPCNVTKPERFRKEILELYLFGGRRWAHVFAGPTGLWYMTWLISQ